MSAARVIHFGVDECYRVAIMRGAGYEVEECGTLMELRAALKSGAPPQAICISETYGRPREDALAMGRAFSEAPVVLFRSTMHRYVCGTFDAEIDEVRAPEEWLKEIETVIATSGKKRRRVQGVRSAGMRSISSPSREMRESAGAQLDEDWT